MKVWDIVEPVSHYLDGSRAWSRAKTSSDTSALVPSRVSAGAGNHGRTPSTNLNVCGEISHVDPKTGSRHWKWRRLPRRTQHNEHRASTVSSSALSDRHPRLLAMGRLGMHVQSIHQCHQRTNGKTNGASAGQAGAIERAGRSGGRTDECTDAPRVGHDGQRQCYKEGTKRATPVGHGSEIWSLL